MVFVPKKDHNHLADSFGLYPVQAQKIDRTKVLKSTPKVIDFNNERSQNQSDSQGTNSNPLRHIAAAAAAVVIGYAGFMAYDDYTQDQQVAQEMQLRQMKQSKRYNKLFLTWESCQNYRFKPSPKRHITSLVVLLR